MVCTVRTPHAMTETYLSTTSIKYLVLQTGKVFETREGGVLLQSGSDFVYVQPGSHFGSFLILPSSSDKLQHKLPVTNRCGKRSEVRPDER